MSRCVVTIEISEYQPKNFNFDNFAFVFTSENKEQEEEITVCIFENLFNFV